MSIPPKHGQGAVVPDHFTEAELAAELGLRIAGLPADGGLHTLPRALPAVVWVDRGDEVLVHLDTLKTRMLDGVLLVSIDLETDQTGRSPLVVTFALTIDRQDPAGLLATTDEYPRGLGSLAARWGRPLQSALWAALLSIAQDHAIHYNDAPQSIVVTRGEMSLYSGAPLAAQTTPEKTE